MRVYLSNYSCCENSQKSVRISKGSPDYFIVRRWIEELFPSDYWIKRWTSVKDSDNNGLVNGTAIEYFEYYWSKLNSLGYTRIAELIKDEEILLCYCGVGKFCHRYILGYFLSLHGWEVFDLRRKGNTVPVDFYSLFSEYGINLEDYVRELKSY